MMKKVKIVANDDFVPDYNFGFPCIVHAVERILDMIYGSDGYQLIIYTHSEYREHMKQEYKAIIKSVNYFPSRLLKDAVFSKVGFRSKDREVQEVIQEVKEADLVIGLYAIVWCGTFYKNKKNTNLEVMKMVLGSNMILFLGKLFGKKTIKTVCSIGPMEYEVVERAAKISSNYLWDRIYVREQKSREELLPFVSKKKEITVLPDLANVMEYQVNEKKGLRPIGISVSFQIINQWQGDEDYVNCITELCVSILEKTDNPVLLIPNEYTPSVKLNDIGVADCIHDKVVQKESVDKKRIQVLDVENITSKQVKNTIASCEALIASRYHACVAALSAGVPTLVVGWHWKYEELLALYSQEQWMITTESCNKERLENIFGEFWESRQKIRGVLNARKEEVYDMLFHAGREMFAIDQM